MLLEKHIPIRAYTTYQVGGIADYFVFAKSRQELKDAITYALEKDIPYFLLGAGANILVSDQGFRGMIIRNLHNSCSVEHWNTIEDHQIHFLRAGSGAMIERIVNFTRANDLSGFEHFVGIPSTVGGALWQNLHFLNQERTGTVFIADILHHAYLLNLQTGDENTFYREDFKFGYDTSILHQKKHIVLDAIFQLELSNFENIGVRMRKNSKWREEKYPSLELFPACVSVFKKIQGIGAGRLIEQSGLKGFSIGGAMISPKHANFIINTGNASATDVYKLIRHVQQVVYDQTGHHLETEIGFVGEFE